MKRSSDIASAQSVQAADTSVQMPQLKQKMQKQKKSRKPRLALRYYVFFCFMIFAVMILLLIWLFQYVFLDRYYESAKIRDISEVADKVADADGESRSDLIVKQSLENNLCIIVTDESGNSGMSANGLGDYSMLDKDVRENHSRWIFELKAKFAKQSNDYFTEDIEDEKTDYKGIIYCRKLSGGDAAYIFIESSAAPMDSTVKIIREQLIYITVILINLAFLVTLLISKWLSKPITSITNTAKQFAAGDYDTDFKGEGYKEVEELSSVLNNAKNEIKKVSDLRKDLVANISHDLRTPLTMVKAYAEMIRDLSGDNPQKRGEHVQIIIDEADRLSALVDNLLELSKLESGNMELELTEFSIVDKLNDCMTRYTLLIEQNGYDIKYEPDEDRIIRADMQKLDQVIYNFINNAINYTGDEKVIRIRQINKQDCVRIEVTDNGKGISKELLPLVFDRYYRDAKVKRAVVGTGLGLSICKEILKKHGFAFGVSSKENVGSTFWFEIPYAKKK